MLSLCLGIVCQTGFTPHAASTRLVRPGCSLLPASLLKASPETQITVVGFRRGAPQVGKVGWHSCGLVVPPVEHA